MKKIKTFKDFLKEAFKDVGIGTQYLKNKGVNIEDDITMFNKLYKTYSAIRGEEEVLKIGIDRKAFIIIKNPRTLKNIEANVRGIIDKEGNIYVEQSQEILHNAIISGLERLNIIKDVDWWWKLLPTEFVTIQRYGDENLFLLGESNDPMTPDDERYYKYPGNSKKLKQRYVDVPKFKTAEPVFLEFIKKARIKNPEIKFKNILIDYYD